ncbi:hypothetical protein HHI36_014107 [Cryptolaemus montrouzieri]|uniref:Uncharacterized protein n=1 Tax=Cryptolaemus montrouzieri TaxID=559131 RepID=A0ABD2N288_9CUCU
MPCLKNSQSVFLCQNATNSYPYCFYKSQCFPSNIPSFLKKLDCRQPFYCDLIHLSLSCEYLLKDVLKNLLKYKYIVGRVLCQILNSKFVINYKSDTLNLLKPLNKKISHSINIILKVLELEYKYLDTIKHRTAKCMKNITYEENFLFMLFSMLFVLSTVVFIVTEFDSPLLLFLWWRNKIS